MGRLSKPWLRALLLVVGVAAAVIVVNYALLGAAVADEPVGKLSPRAILAETERDEPATTAEPPPQTAPETSTEPGATTADATTTGDDGPEIDDDDDGDDDGSGRGRGRGRGGDDDRDD